MLLSYGGGRRTRDHNRPVDDATLVRRVRVRWHNATRESRTVPRDACRPAGDHGSAVLVPGLAVCISYGPIRPFWKSEGNFINTHAPAWRRFTRYRTKQRCTRLTFVTFSHAGRPNIFSFPNAFSFFFFLAVRLTGTNGYQGLRHP